MNGSRIHHGYLCQLLNIQGINNVKQNEIHTTAMSPKSSGYDVHMATEKVKDINCHILIKLQQL
jgi:hypothetical protein